MLNVGLVLLVSQRILQTRFDAAIRAVENDESCFYSKKKKKVALTTLPTLHSPFAWTVLDDRVYLDVVVAGRLRVSRQ